MPEAPNKYKTPLTPDEMTQFSRWYKAVSDYKGLNPNPDDPQQKYDYWGFWKNEKNRDDMLSGKADAHFIDKYKMPGHPTFSTESQYSNSDTPGGTWTEENGKWVFTHSPFTARYATDTDAYLKQSGNGEIAVNPYAEKSKATGGTMPNPYVDLQKIFPSAFDAQGSMNIGKPVTTQPGATPMQIINSSPAPAPVQAQPDYSQYMFQKPVDVPQRLSDMGIVDRASLAQQLNANVDARDDTRKKFILGQILGAVLGAGAGRLAGNNAQQNLDNTIPAITGTQMMLQNSAAQDAADRSLYQSGLKQYYDAMHNISQENAKIASGNQTTGREMYKIDSEAKTKAAEQAAKAEIEARKAAEPKRQDGYIDGNGHRILVTGDNAGNLTQHDLGAAHIPSTSGSMDHERIQNEKEKVATIKRINKNVDQYRKNETALGKLRQGGADAEVTASLYGKGSTVNEAIAALEREQADIEQENDGLRNSVGYGPGGNAYRTKLGIAVPTAATPGQGHSGKVTPGEMF